MGIRVLAVSDEVDEGLAAGMNARGSADVILACGDLPSDYLAMLMNALDAPLVFVPGNHDPDLSGYRQTRTGLITLAGFPAAAPWPAGALSADGDPPHRGFGCYHGLIADLAPAALLHGHVRPSGDRAPERVGGRTTICNVAGWRLLDIMQGSDLRQLRGGYRHAV